MKLKEIWNNIKKVILSIVYGIFCEKTATSGFKFSLGRLLLLSTFILSLIKWIPGTEIPQTMLTILLVLLGYNLGTKALTAIEQIVKKK